MSTTYIKFSLANGGGGDLFGSKPVMMYSAKVENPPFDNLVEQLANERFPQETPFPLHIYKVETVELDKEQVALLDANPKHLI